MSRLSTGVELMNSRSTRAKHTTRRRVAKTAQNGREKDVRVSFWRNLWLEIKGIRWRVPCGSFAARKLGGYVKAPFVNDQINRSKQPILSENRVRSVWRILLHWRCMNGISPFHLGPFNLDMENSRYTRQEVGGWGWHLTTNRRESMQKLPY